MSARVSACSDETAATNSANESPLSPQGGGLAPPRAAARREAARVRRGRRGVDGGLERARPPCRSQGLRGGDPGERVAELGHREGAVAVGVEAVEQLPERGGLGGGERARGGDERGAAELVERRERLEARQHDGVERRPPCGGGSPPPAAGAGRVPPGQPGVRERLGRRRPLRRVPREQGPDEAFRLVGDRGPRRGLQVELARQDHVEDGIVGVAPERREAAEADVEDDAGVGKKEFFEFFLFSVKKLGKKTCFLFCLSHAPPPPCPVPHPKLHISAAVE